MIYFKTVTVEDCSRNQLETALRKVSLKRTSSLDMVGSSTNIGTDKFFLGYEGKNSLTFTRIRASIERFLPKLIIKLSATNESSYYQIRFNILSIAVFFGVLINWFIALISLLAEPTKAEGFLIITIFVGIYFSLIFLEIKLTEARVNNAIKLIIAPNHPVS
jgi:hypothetical protein